jgi:hypothetical protein
MKKKGWERFLRLHNLVKQERMKILRKKKPKWAECVTAGLPALSNYSRNEEWAKRLKEKLNSNTIM